jgi:hypothetical protein
MSDKLGPSIRNDGLGHPMQTHDVRNIHLRVLLSPVEVVHRNEMSRLGEPIDNYPDGVKLAGGESHIILSCNDFPSQHWSESHIILSHVRRYSNARFLPSVTDSR